MPETETSPPPDGMLLRLPVSPGPWAEGLPPVPEGADVTVAFSRRAAWAEHEEALRLLGYRVVGVHDGATLDSAADFLIARPVLRTFPRWALALNERATRTYDLAMGPVAVLLADALAVHRHVTHPPRR
jgi:hypothetical protein